MEDVLMLIAVVTIVALAMFMIIFLSMAEATRRREKEEKEEKEALAKRAKEDSTRFYQLHRIDLAHGKRSFKKYDNIALADICQQFNAYAAGELGLYYEPGTIREWVAGMGVSHILILQGMSGTGKTSLPYAFGRFLGNDATIVPIQPSWKDRSDMLGYFNEFTGKFNETPLLEKMYEAGNSDDIYLSVLDEVNIARVEYYFAEFLSLLEIPAEEKRKITVVSDVRKNDPERFENGKLQLPPNMWFIGTANNDDSTFAISDKVYDRAMILNFDQKSKPFVPDSYSSTSVNISYRNFRRLISKATTTYGMTRRNGGKVAMLDAYLSENFIVSFGNRIQRQMERYVAIYIACGGSEVEALDAFISAKVLRKLESKNPILVQARVDELCRYLDELFGENVMIKCKEYLKRFRSV